MAYTTIDDPSEYFQTTLYTGNGGTQSVTNGGNSDLQPDWLWIKDRDDTYKHILVDSVRGATKHLASSSNAAEITNTANVTSFASDGFALSSDGNVNANADKYVAWQWKETATAGFDIVSYTGTGSARTISHSLSAVPKWIIVKKRNGEDNWNVYHEAMGNTHFMSLNEDGAKEDSAARWNDTTPTSSVFTVGTDDRVNTNTATYIAYLFAEKKGYSKFGSYTGNGNVDGTFVYTGFKPAMVILKSSTSSADWELADNKRTTSGGNVIDKEVRPNTNAAETGGTDGRYIDFFSNGFKLRQAFGNWNGSGETYIFMAFAENPFVTSTGVPTTAR